ncbi:hypothetical protein [Marinicellulosiphila megalodicopiae]|uniref:hypothetical protein n=1 Tax=Marinicellulosiphila megalodicopiae TaxID=2724896 RepID=UPI003BB0F8CD
MNNTIHTLNNQKGIALLAMLAVIMIIFTGAIITSVSLNRQKIDQSQVYSKTISNIQKEIIGYAINQSTPGLLPCPDINGDGISDLQGSNCTRNLGYLPYVTLSAERILDSSGAVLWYGVDPQYTRIITGVNLNSSLDSNIFVDNQSVAFVLLKANTPVNNQVRSNNNPINYFEDINANNDFTQFISTSTNTDFNDEIFSVSLTDYWRHVESFVGANVKQSLLTYYNQPSCNEFPWASTQTASPFDSDINTEFGFLPTDQANAFANAAGCPTSLNLPLWVQRHWQAQLHYVFCGPSGNQCISLVNAKTLSANSIILLPGNPLSGQNRPSAAMVDYFERDNNDLDATFEFSLSRHLDSTFNDQLIIVLE